MSAFPASFFAAPPKGIAPPNGWSKRKNAEYTTQGQPPEVAQAHANARQNKRAAAAAARRAVRPVAFSLEGGRKSRKQRKVKRRTRRA